MSFEKRLDDLENRNIDVQKKAVSEKIQIVSEDEIKCSVLISPLLQDMDSKYIHKKCTQNNFQKLVAYVTKLLKVNKNLGITSLNIQSGLEKTTATPVKNANLLDITCIHMKCTWEKFIQVIMIVGYVMLNSET